MYGQGVVLGASTTVAGAIVLPNTGSNRLFAVVAVVAIVTGVAMLLTTAASFIAKKAYKV